jgi:hypothetical protein
MRLRQVVLAAADLEAVVGQIRDVFEIEVAYRDPGVELFDLRNAVMAIGDTFLEVVSPLNENAAAARYRDKRGGDCGYMVMVQSDDYRKDRARIEDLGIRIVWSAELDEISGMHLHPRDTGGPLLSLDEPTPPASWLWAGPRWTELVATGNAREVIGAEISDPDPAERARRWGEILARPPRRTGETWTVELDGGSLRFVGATDPRGVGLTQIDLHLRDPAAARRRAESSGVATDGGAIEIAGTRFRLEPLR